MKTREKKLQQMKEYYQKNKDKMKQNMKEYAEKNREKILEQKRKYWKENKEKLNKKQKEYYDKNRDYVLKLQKDWRKKNKEHFKEWTLEDYLKHKEIKNKRSLEYYYKHHKEIRLHSREYAKNRVAQQKAIVFNHYSNGNNCCALCQMTDMDVLTVDHINGGGTQHRREMKGVHIEDWLIKHNFPEGFRVLCWNCQAKERKMKHQCRAPNKIDFDNKENNTP